MGIEDRDWYREKKAQEKVKDSLYDPKQFRRGIGQEKHGHDPFPDFQNNANKQAPSLIRSAGGWLLLVLGFALLFNYAPSIQRSWDEHRQTGLPHIPSMLAGKPSCNPYSLPENGALQVTDPSRVRRTDILFAGLEIKNKHPHHVIAYLTDSGTGQSILGLSVQSGKAAQINVPVGNYGLFFLSGTSWCNHHVGFQDGARTNIQGGVEIQSGGTKTLSLTTEHSAHPERLQISSDHRLPQATRPTLPTPGINGADFVDIVQRTDGHYYAAGYVNGMPIVFMVDTGATLTSLSQDMAQKSGIHSCTPRTFNTANGSVQGCIATASQIQIGGFILRDIAVAVMPSLPTDALLGMNLMQLFRLEQQSGVMRISIR